MYVRPEQREPRAQLLLADRFQSIAFQINKVFSIGRHQVHVQANYVISIKCYTREKKRRSLI